MQCKRRHVPNFLADFQILHGFRDLEDLDYIRRVLARVSNELNVRFCTAHVKKLKFFRDFLNRTLRYHTYFSK